MKYIVPFMMKYGKPVLSIFINLVYWIFHIFNLNEALKEMAEMKKQLKTLKDVEQVVNKFVWRKELIDWYPWVITIINSKLKDDCDGAAFLGQWLLKCIGTRSDIIYLVVSNWRGGHAVCVSKDKTTMISNADVISINPDNWKFDILKQFNFKYKHII